MKKYILTLIITTAALLAAATQAQGAVYTVKQDGTGDFTTIQACANQATAGGTCMVYPGAYDERVKATSSGVAGSPVTFQASGNAKVKGFTITNKSYITIQGFEITHDGFTAEPYPGSSPTASIFLTSSSNIRIIGNTIHMTEGNGIYFYDHDPSTASNNVLIKDNVVFRCGGLNSSAPYTGIYVYGNYNRVEGNDISHNGEDFMRLTGGNYNVIRDNRLHDNLLSDWPGVHVKEPPHIDGLQNWCASTNGLALHWTLIENNILLNAPSANSHFVIFQDSGNCGSSDIIIRHNTVSNLGDYFLVTGVLVKNIRIYGNTAVNVGIANTVKDWTDIAYVNNATGGKVINNLFYNTVRNGGNEAYADASSSAGFFADYNLGYNSECAGSCIWTNPRPGIGQEPHAVLNKDPLFINAADDFHLQTNSPAKNAGGPLTHVAVLDPGNGNTLSVDDAGFFQDGWTSIEADWIAVGAADNAAQIKSIDYMNNIITLVNSLSRRPGDSVWLYKDSSGRQVLSGNAPDIGAYEYVAPIIPADRRIDWSQAGIPGGIPSRTTIYATIDAATYGNGTTDATAAIQNALNSCPDGQVVYLPAGKYRIASTITLPSRKVLRGAGPQQTILDAQGSGKGVIIFGQGTSLHAPPFVSAAITGGLTAGSKNIIVSSAAGITVGSYLMITELNPEFVTTAGSSGNCTWCDYGWNGTRALGQIVEVTSVDGVTIGITPGLYLDYSSELSPLASPFSAGAKYAGVEDLQVYANNTGYTSNFYMNATAYCWVKNVEGNYTDGDHLEAFLSYRGEIRDSYFHDAFHHTPGSTDADVFIAHKSSGMLVENNILRRLHASIMLNWGASGNVIAYNYSDGNFDQNAANVCMMDLSVHGAHPMFNLWEGNVAVSLHPDGIWGSSSHNTAFRNWLKGTTRIYNPLSGRGPLGNSWWAVQANRAVNLDFACRYYNFVGNVVGSDDMLQLTSYNNGTRLLPAVAMVVAPQFRSYDAETYGYNFGYSGNSSDNGSRPEDNSLPYTTALIHGDYNWVNGTATWDPSISNHSLPASLYLSAKPSWWGDLSWPAIGPDVTGLVNKIPAQARFEQMSLGDISGDGTVTAYDAALALQLGKTELEAGQIGQKAAGLL